MGITHSNRWIEIQKCPGCESRNFTPQGKITVSRYRFGNQWLDLPARGVPVCRCENCGLRFKEILPSVDFVTDVMKQTADEVWNDPYSHEDDAELVAGLTKSQRFDVLDVGSSNGYFLQAAASKTQGRLSALDTIEYPELKKRIRGEFIQGTIDDGALDWNGDPYDVVTVFDVLEHLYDPAQAFRNLKKLVRPGGFLVIETGDAESSWPNRYGIHRWWYASWFVHHIFWTERSLLRAAQKSGFQLKSIERKKHKSRIQMKNKVFLKECLKTSLYSVAPRFYTRFAETLGAQGIQPYSPFTQDHIRAVFALEPSLEQL